MNVREIKQKAEEQKVSAALVFKEYVHLIILEYLFRKGLFSDLVFQGGTALRLAYQGIRYSEDLDFVLKNKNAPCFDKLSLELKSLTSQIKKSIPFISDAHLKIQKQTSSFKRYCLILKTDFLGSIDRTNIEIANIPSHQYQTIILKHPAIPLSPAIVVETTKEILSDKLLAFAARDYLKGRDIWDIYFLINTLKVSVDKEIVAMVKKKISDYGLKLPALRVVFKRKLKELEEKGVLLLHEEMDRFLPGAYRDAFESHYSDICRHGLGILNNLLKELKNDH